MKRCLTFLGVVLLLGCQSSTKQMGSITDQPVEPKTTMTPGVAAASFEWAQDYDRALAVAKETNKIVMVDVYTDWCVWCKRLDKGAFSDKNVAAKLAKDFVPVKVNPEKSEKNAKLAKELGVRGFPHIAFLDTTGRKLAQIEGYLPADEFLRKLNEVTEQAKKQ